MRVIAGVRRGAKLDAPSGRDTRPITDRGKETIFNIVSSDLGAPGGLPDIAVLDLFAGSGAFGIEALSRGARSCLFVERARPALKALRSNIQKLRFDEEARISAANAWTMRLPPTVGGYGLIFVDPPYREVNDTQRMLDLLERAAGRLAVNGVLMFRHSEKARFTADPLRERYEIDERALGTMRLIFLRLPPSQAASAPRVGRS